MSSAPKSRSSPATRSSSSFPASWASSAYTRGTRRCSPRSSPGALRIKLPDQDREELVFVQGGFLEVQPHRVTVLADTAIRAKDLDEVKALEAKKAAEEAMQNKTSTEEIASAQAELASALAQLEAIRKMRHRA